MRYQPQKPWYSYNLSNTAIFLIITLITVPALYCKVWYPDRIKHVITFEQDTLVRNPFTWFFAEALPNQLTQDWASFPSIALFQRIDWTSQANLVSWPGKCFLGWHDEAAPACDKVEPGTLPCKCGGNWASDVNTIVWRNATYSYKTLKATPSMVSLAPTTQLIH